MGLILHFLVQAGEGFLDIGGEGRIGDRARNGGGIDVGQLGAVPGKAPISSDNAVDFDCGGC